MASSWKLGSKGDLFDSKLFIDKALSLASKWKQKWSTRELPWYAEEKSKKGAYAAFLGIEIYEYQDHIKWKGMAIGDCCFVIYKKEGISSFPIEDPSEFGVNPILIPTHANDINDLESRLQYKSGKCNYDDTLILLSDAIANWFLVTQASDKSKLERFIDLVRSNRRKELLSLIDEERNSNALRNDDIAIILIAIDKEVSK